MVQVIEYSDRDSGASDGDNNSRLADTSITRRLIATSRRRQRLGEERSIVNGSQSVEEGSCSRDDVCGKLVDPG